MNNNRNNNRRRGRGNNRGSGGGNQSNRIDSRARGNAPQMLEKYRKLANDAALNDDRVQTEYYLQFADHYFRVIADNRTQKDDGRSRRDGERDSSDDDEDDIDDSRERGAGERQPQGSSDRDEDESGRGKPRERNRSFDDDGGEEEEGGEGETSNPFIRDARSRRPRQRRANGGGEREAGQDGVDPGVLPPSISRDAEEPAPRKPARSRRAAKPAEDGDGGPLEAVS